MNENCFEIGAIQAFVDGESTPELSFRITEHSAKCPDCAQLMAVAEEENAQVFAVLDRELNSLVPTQRLWSNISVAIAEEKGRAPVWGKVRAFALALFANPSLAAAASVLIIFGLFAAVWTLRAPVSNAPVASAGPSVQQPAPAPIRNGDVGTGAEVESPTAKPVIEVGTTSHSPEKLRKMVQNTVYRSETRRADAQYAIADEGMVGEESYVRTIANLKESVDSKKDLLMDPSTRVAFERDVAVVNDAIDRMKEVVRREPKNQAAKQVLYSSYQNKIDLLRSVVEREELMAAIQ